MAVQVSEPAAAASFPRGRRWAGEPGFMVRAGDGLLFVVLSAARAAGLSDWLGDTDDAVRLVAVRELLAGAPWFDTTLPRIGAPEPLVSHWSRLIDLPLALLMLLLRPLFGVEGAEIAARIAWPTVLFFVLQLVLVEAQLPPRRAWAPAFVFTLPVLSPCALVQFKPGRIDHHNAMILCAVAGVLFLARSLEESASLGLPVRCSVSALRSVTRPSAYGAGARDGGDRRAMAARRTMACARRHRCRRGVARCPHRDRAVRRVGSTSVATRCR